jgi:hypothetical protein
MPALAWLPSWTQRLSGPALDGVPLAGTAEAS